MCSGTSVCCAYNVRFMFVCIYVHVFHFHTFLFLFFLPPLFVPRLRCRDIPTMGGRIWHLVINHQMRLAHSFEPRLVVRAELIARHLHTATRVWRRSCAYRALWWRPLDAILGDFVRINTQQHCSASLAPRTLWRPINYLSYATTDNEKKR